MDFKSLLGTNVDSLHSDTVNGYLYDRTSIHLAHRVEKMCDCDTHIRLIYLMGFHGLTITARFGSYF